MCPNVTMVMNVSPEFDNWYSESFLMMAEDGQTSLGVGHGTKPGVVPPVSGSVTVSTLKSIHLSPRELLS